jgi:uncharacterized protein YxeA
MKKVLAILISLLFSFSVVAFAEEATPTDTGTSKVEQKSEPVKTKKPTKKVKKARKSKKSKKAKKSEKTEKTEPESQK